MRTWLDLTPLGSGKFTSNDLPGPRPGMGPGVATPLQAVHYERVGYEATVSLIETDMVMEVALLFIYEN